MIPESNAGRQGSICVYVSRFSTLQGRAECSLSWEPVSIRSRRCHRPPQISHTLAGYRVHRLYQNQLHAIVAVRHHAHTLGGGLLHLLVDSVESIKDVAEHSSVAGDMNRLYQVNILRCPGDRVNIIKKKD